MYILLAILIFGVLIMAHELGHFITAKLLGVQVNEFSICMGPAIFKKQIGETTYALRCIPIGGYCAMEGEDEQSENPRAFTAKPAWARAIILVAGSAANFLIALLILFAVFCTAKGFYEPVITAFEPGCPYEGENALQVGDRITAIDGEKVYIYSDLTLLWSRNRTGVFDMEVERNGERVLLEDFEFRRIDYVIDGETVQRYGVTFSVVEATFGRILQQVWRNAADFLRLTRMGLFDLFSGMVSMDDMSGPVGIVTAISDTGKQSATAGEAISNISYLAAYLAVNLAFMNLLPIPALDGGRVFFLVVTALIEKLTRRRIDPKYEGYVHAAGMILLLAFMALITYKDIAKLFVR